MLVSELVSQDPRRCNGRPIHEVRLAFSPFFSTLSNRRQLTSSFTNWLYVSDSEVCFSYRHTSNSLSPISRICWIGTDMLGRWWCVSVLQYSLKHRFYLWYLKSFVTGSKRRELNWSLLRRKCQGKQYKYNLKHKEIFRAPPWPSKIYWVNCFFFLPFSSLFIYRRIPITGSCIRQIFRLIAERLV